jgi:hypothetical protein
MVLGLLALMTSQCIAGPPAISVIPDQVVAENGRSAALPFTVNLTNYGLKGASSDPQLFPSTNIVFGGSSSKPTVTISAAPNRLGQATITIEADGAGGGAITTFLVTVTAQLHIERFRTHAIVSWTATNTVAQAARQLGAGWSDVSFTNSYSVPIEGIQFFRLRQK